MSRKMRLLSQLHLGWSLMRLQYHDWNWKWTLYIWGESVFHWICRSSAHVNKIRWTYVLISCAEETGILKICVFFPGRRGSFLSVKSFQPMPVPREMVHWASHAFHVQLAQKITPKHFTFLSHTLFKRATGPRVRHRFSAFWLRSKCSICSYQLNIWYVPYMGTTILNWFLVSGEMSGACSALATGWPGIAVPPGSAHQLFN